MSGLAQAYRFTFTRAERPVRLILNGIVVAESARAMVMRETRLPPVFYFPLDDVWLGLVTQTDHRTYCPFKGNASFYTNELKVIEYGQSRQSNELSESPQYANLLVGWLMRDAPEAKSGRELTAQLAERLLANGVPLWRLAVVIRTLHPQVVSFA
jgi:adenylate cyclase